MGLCTQPLLPRALPGQATSAGKSGAHAGPLEPGARGPCCNSRTKSARLRATTLHTWRQQQTIDNNVGQNPAHTVAFGNSNASVKSTTRSSSDATGYAGGCSARPRATSRASPSPLLPRLRRPGSQPSNSRARRRRASCAAVLFSRGPYAAAAHNNAKRGAQSPRTGATRACGQFRYIAIAHCRQDKRLQRLGPVCVRAETQRPAGLRRLSEPCGR